MPLQEPRSGTIEGLQILRAVAALMVVFHHARHSIPGGDRWPAVGEAGVDVFFVISGFVMAHTTRHLRVGPVPAQRLAVARDFIAKRLLRVVPLYWLVLLWTNRRDLAAGRFGIDLLKDFAFVPHPNAVYPDRLWPTMIQGWTLNYEMFFYALFAGALLFGRRRLIAVGAVLAGFAALGAMTAAVGVDASSEDWRGVALRFYTDDILLEFGFGVMLQQLVARGALPALPASPGLAVMVAGFALLALGHGHAPRSLFQGVPAVLIVWGSFGAFAGARLPTWERLGAASYAIYLIHWASFGAVKPVSNLLGAAGATPAGSALLLVLLMLSAVVAGWGLHRFVERPFLHWAQQRLPNAAPKPVAMPGGPA